MRVCGARSLHLRGSNYIYNFTTFMQAYQCDMLCLVCVCTYCSFQLRIVISCFPNPPPQKRSNISVIYSVCPIVHCRWNMDVDPSEHTTKRARSLKMMEEVKHANGSYEKHKGCIKAPLLTLSLAVLFLMSSTFF